MATPKAVKRMAHACQQSDGGMAFMGRCQVGIRLSESRGKLRRFQHRRQQVEQAEAQRMAIKTKFGLKKKGRDAYLELVIRFPLTSIKSEQHLAEAQAVMDRLLAEEQLDHGKEEYLDALSDLVGTYEDAHHAIEPASDADMLRHLLEANGVTQAQLSRETGLTCRRHRWFKSASQLSLDTDYVSGLWNHRSHAWLERPAMAAATPFLRL